MARANKIRKILIANRGEIACRVIRTATRLGIRTAAVYSDADQDALHVVSADEAYHLGPAPAAQSYLDIGKIIAAAKQAGAEAIHPGYGFLAENPAFAEACRKAGIIFVGPGAEAIRAMGSKAQAKRIMEKAGVPVVPGYHGRNQDLKTLTREAEKTGFPVLIKPVAGGGGKGMRKVASARELEAALKGAKREAKGAFGDERVLIEKYIETPRHIEVQVFGDHKGGAVHLYERDCSLQRRHQKVIEEAPAPGMTMGLRERLTEAAVRAAKAIGYVNAGTVEFIVDAAGGLSDETPFYFMEMNTRLQVEHPVTEMVTGLDLVEWQIRVARGEPLPLAQNQIAMSGAAVEARLYAEDPQAEFLPQTGTLHWFRFPGTGDHLRLDSGVDVGDAVTVHYDPMLAKLIAAGATRAEALSRLADALSAGEVAGVKTNLPFLAALVRDRDFRNGQFSTHTIDDHLERLLPKPPLGDDEALAVAALTLIEDRRRERERETPGDPTSPWKAGGWRLNLDYRESLRFSLHGKPHEVEVRPRGGEGLYEIAIDGRVRATGYRDGAHPFPATTLEISGDTRTLHTPALRAGGTVYLMEKGFTLEARILEAAAGAEEEVEGPGRIAAPMPGKILEVLTRTGAKVEKGAPLIVMEAMKMEYTLKAPRGGTVKTLAAKAGEQVSEGKILLDIAD